MVANPGGITLSVYDGTGSPLIVINEFFDPATGAMKDRTITTSVGSRTGALIVDNMTGKTQQVIATGDDGAVKTFSIPASGRAFTAAQLATVPAPNGPITTISDLAGISPSLVA